MTIPKITLIGVGLLGGSIGLAARQRGVAGQVTGFVRRTESVEECRAAGAVDVATLDLAEAVTGAELVILCTPVGGMKAMAEAIKPYLAPDAVVTDVGSVKASVVTEVEPVLPRFVGSHPMAGSEQTGVANARADLFENAVCAVTSTDQSDAACVARVNEFWTALGSHVISLPAAEHDTIVARTSHLPHVLASALVNAVLGQLREGEAAFLGTGFRDTTRLASGSSAMWRDIAMDNAPAIEQAIDDLQAELATLKTALNAREATALETFFAKGQEFRQQWITGLKDVERE